MGRQSLKDGSDSFDVTILEEAAVSRIVLFAVGGGGNPERHLPLLACLARAGCRVVAPHFDRLVSPQPTEDQLRLRARRLTLALDSVAQPGLPVAGVGHSLGATLLLALAGAQAWMGPGQPIPIAADGRLGRLALLAPATGYFQAPGALDGLRAPILAFAGTRDDITPPAQAQALERGLAPRVPIEVRVVENAGHFSFMHLPPPQIVDPLPDRDAFLARLEADLCGFVAG